MSCNGCRVLRKGCSDTCILRPCLQWIESPESQGHATLFVAKFYGRAGLMSFISNVPESQRPGLFESLLFEAAGRTVNPVNGAVGLLWAGNWDICQAAVETVLRGGALRPISPKLEDDMLMLRKRPSSDRNRRRNKQMGEYGDNDDISLVAKRMREETPSEEKSDTTTCFEDHYFYYNNNNNATLGGGQPKLLNLF